jgi:hypothetical protein
MRDWMGKEDASQTRFERGRSATRQRTLHSESSQRHLLPGSDAYINHHRNVVAELSPLSERPDFYRFQPPILRNEHVVDVEWLVLMAVEVIGRARFASLIFAVMSVVRAD